MVEYTTGRLVRKKQDKVVIWSNISELEKYLREDESFIQPALRTQTAKDKIKEYNIGNYKIFAICLKDMKNPLKWQLFGGELYKRINKCRSIEIYFPENFAEYIYDFALGIELASYRFDKYFTKKPADFYPKLEKITFIGSKLKSTEIFKKVANLSNAVRYARDLANEPANYLTPQVMADDIKRLEYLGLEVTILDEKAMKKENFNLALAVAQGSQNKPRIAVIKWRGNKEKDDFDLGLVGKGVTFDSGGLSLKSATNMDEMKQDMAGAGVIAATMKSIALQKTQKNVVAVVGLVENMPSGNAYRPGDIITSMSGQTVEIINTDAEGRLVLADCLTYIQQQFKVQHVIDIATLTGAIMIALGSTFAGIFSNNNSFGKKIYEAGEKCGERLWHMPLDKSYDKMLDSSIADIKNHGGRLGGSSVAACFLYRFIEKGVVWAHIDIAGMMNSDGKNALYPKGASGFGVILMNKFINEF